MLDAIKNPSDTAVFGEKERESLYHRLLEYFQEYGVIPDFTLTSKTQTPRLVGSGKEAMTSKTLRAAKMLADSSGDDQTLDDIIAALCGYGPLMNHSGNQLAAMLVRHVLVLQATGAMSANCRDRTCGALDCETCQGAEAAEEYRFCREHGLTMGEPHMECAVHGWVDVLVDKDGEPLCPRCESNTKENA